jgi:RNA recognition motif-containing protein
LRSPTRRLTLLLCAQATEPLLAAFFSAFGQVVEFKVVMDPMTGVSRGFGFVAFATAEAADALKALRTVDFFGKTARRGAARRGAVLLLRAHLRVCVTRLR